MNKSKWVLEVERFFGDLSSVGLGWFYNFTPLIAPLAPALAFGYNVFTSALASEIAQNPATGMAFAAAIGLEGAGMMAFKSFIIHMRRVQEEERIDGRFIMSCVGILGYAAVGGGTAMIDHVSPTMRFLTFVTFGITFLCYMAVELMNDAKTEREKQEEADILDREDDRVDRQLQQKLKEYEAKQHLQEERKQKQHERDMERRKLELEMKAAEGKLAPQIVTMQATSPVSAPSAEPVYKNWSKVPDEEKVKIADMTPSEIHSTYQTANTRTARNWLKYAKDFVASQDNGDEDDD